MRSALVDRRSGLVFMVVWLDPVPETMRARWDVVASESAQAGDRWLGGDAFEPLGPRPRAAVGDRYAEAGAHATLRAIDRLPAGDQAAALLRGKP